jgi:hypothetical protein
VSCFLLQSFDVGCFSPFQRAYSREIENLIRHHINHIAKLEFLPVFKAAFHRSFKSVNICSAFQGEGLVPHQPDVVLSWLDIQLRAPTPVAGAEALWEARTPSSVRELEDQSTLIRERFRKHKSSSPALGCYDPERTRIGYGQIIRKGHRLGVIQRLSIIYRRIIRYKAPTTSSLY